MKYNIGDKYFKSKKQCYEYARDYIKNIGCCDVYEDNEHYKFLIDLLNNHSGKERKIGVGILYFKITRDVRNSNAYNTAVYRVDNSFEIFSWVYCCEFKPRPEKTIINWAMRNAVYDITSKYKRDQPILVCNFCKLQSGNITDYHTDHDNPSFLQLQIDFFKITKFKQPVGINRGDYKFNDEDADYKNDWVKYHNSNCNFQILCKICNLSKPK